MSKYSHIDFTPPQGVRSAYKTGLKLHEEGKTGSGLEAATVSMARKLAGGSDVSPEWARKGNRFWGRNERFLSEKNDSPAYASAMLWGGRPGMSWFRKLYKQMEAADKAKNELEVNVIRKEPDGYHVYSEKGKHLGGPYTEQEAKKRLAQIEYFKGKNMRLNVVNTIKSNQEVSEKIIRGKKHTVVHGVTHMIADTVMNGIYYPREEVELLCHSLENQQIIMPAEHPVDDEGNFMSASSPLALISNLVGAFAFNFSMRGDKLISDMAICPELAMMNEYGADILDTIDNKEDMDMSTGFYLTTEIGNGVAPDGNEYGKTARNLKMDHSAILPISPGAKQSNEGVGMFANSALDSSGNTVDMNTFVSNMGAAQFNLPLSSVDATDWLERKAVEEIKEFTKSGDKPSSNYRKFFAHFDRDNADDFDAYFYPFARVVDGRPMAHPKAIEEIKSALAEGKIPDSDRDGVKALVAKYENEEAYSNASNEELSMFQRFKKFLKGENENSNGYNMDNGGEVAANNQDEEAQMRKTMMARMVKNGYDQAKLDKMSDDEMMNAYGDMMKKSGKGNMDDMDDKKKSKMDNAADQADVPMFDEDRDHKQGNGEDKEDGTKYRGAMNSEAPAWAKQLIGRIDSIESAMNKQTDSEVDKLAEFVSNSQGISKEAAKGIPLDTLKTMAANSGYVAFNTGSTATATNASQGVANDFDNMEAPE